MRIITAIPIPPDVVLKESRETKVSVRMRSPNGEIVKLDEGVPLSKLPAEVQERLASGIRVELEAVTENAVPTMGAEVLAPSK